MRTVASLLSWGAGRRTSQEAPTSPQTTQEWLEKLRDNQSMPGVTDLVLATQMYYLVRDEDRTIKRRYAQTLGRDTALRLQVCTPDTEIELAIDETHAWGATDVPQMFANRVAAMEFCYQGRSASNFLLSSQVLELWQTCHHPDDVTVEDELKVLQEVLPHTRTSLVDTLAELHASGDTYAADGVAELVKRAGLDDVHWDLLVSCYHWWSCRPENEKRTNPGLVDALREVRSVQDQCTTRDLQETFETLRTNWGGSLTELAEMVLVLHEHTTVKS